MQRAPFTSLILCMVLLSVCAAASNAPDPWENRTLRVASELDYPPLAVVRPDGTADGFSVELLHAVADAMGLQLQIQVGPWSEILRAARHGEIDILPNVAWSPERERYLDFTVPHSVQSAGVFLPASSEIRSVEDIRGRRIIVMKGDAAHEYVQREQWSEHLLEATSLTEAVDRLRRGEGDCLVAGRVMGLQTLKAMGISDVVVLPDKLPGSEQKFCIAVPQGRGDLLAKLNEGLAIVKADGRYDAIFERWLAVYEPPRPLHLREFLPHAAAVLTVCTVGLALLLGWMRLLYRRLHRHRDELRKLSRVVEQMPVSVAITDRTGRVEYVNPAFEQSTGYTTAEVVGRPPRVLDASQQWSDQRTELWTAAMKGRSVGGEIQSRRATGELAWERLSVSPLRDSTDSITHCVFIAEDITDRRRMEQDLRVAATMDRLTGLPNRASFQKQLDQGLDRRRQDPTHRLAVLFLDLDDFKKVNDSLGHNVGDQLLCAMATRLREMSAEVTETTPDTELTVARLGGDEFVILAQGLFEEDWPAALADRVLHALGRRYELGGYDIVSTASIGIVSGTWADTSAEEILRTADTAMYAAKRSQRGSHFAFDQGLYHLTEQRWRLESELRRAVDADQIHLVYQPIIDLQTGALSGVEALARWQHPEFGLVSPEQFIPLAEETGLIVPLGLTVLRKAAHQMADWRRRLGEDAPARVSVNLSRRQMLQHDLLPRTLETISEAGLDSSALQFEVTESMVMEDVRGSAELLRRFRRAGIMVAMDDFGKGHSSLACLHQLPFSSLKIDRSFVERLDSQRSLAALVQAMIQVAEHLGIATVAEGVETEGQLAALQAMECRFAQGYYFSRPVDGAQFEASISGHDRQAA